MSTVWDHELAALLHELSQVQDELLELLQRRAERLLSGDTQGLAELHEHEQQLIARLQACHDQRRSLLEKAEQEGLPADSIRSLAKALPRPQRDRLSAPLRETSARARLLRHKSLANWVVVQRSLIHLAQLLEIIATGGREQPTYGKGPAQAATSSGALVDQAA